ncbi:MAG: signal peptide peptidase SppA [Bacteroidota bacterium]
MNFFKTFFASFLAVILGVLIGIPIIFMLVAGIFGAIASAGQQEVQIKPHTILKIELKEQIVEDASPSGIDFDISQFVPLPVEVSASQIGLYQIVRNLEAAATDENIDGIYLNLSPAMQAGWASLKSIREALVDFKNSGKFVYAYAEIYTEPSYYLASVADSIYMPNQGRMEFNGLASSPMFYAGLFEKVGISPQVFKVGTFKSATEQYTRKDMSAANKEQIEILLDDIWQSFAEEVAPARDMSQEQLNEIANSFMIGGGNAAQRVGLVDQSDYEDAVLTVLAERSSREKLADLRLVSLNKYLRVAKKRKRGDGKIAIIFAEGTIQTGKSGQGVAGSESIVKALRKAREDKNVKAVVLRVNSPGGMALAADLMAHEVEECAKVKTVVASMGDYAASGGYYIAAPCDRIFAQANTITGSIGIFSVLFDPRELLNQNIGLTFDEVETHPHANFLNPMFPISEAERTFFQAQTEEGYGTFIEVVRAGRDFKDSVAVDKIAQGRVWSGASAQRINLVDELGSLNDAIAYAAEQAGLGDQYRIVRFSAPQDPFEELMNGFGASAKQDLAPFKEEIRLYQEFKRNFPRSGTYALMPYQMPIR